MNNLIKELTWHHQEGQYTTKSPTHSYRITSANNKFKIIYCKLYDGFAREATGFNTLEEAKQWAFNHHCEKLSKWLNPDWSKKAVTPYVREVFADWARTDPLTDTVNWFKEAKPEPTAKDICVQIGCHYEEVSEFDSAISNNCEDNAYNSEYYKRTKDCEAAKLKLKPGKVNSVEVLDSLADQIVTAVGVAYMMGFDIIGALKEVNASNWSKFENGKAVTDENGKIVKGSDYFKPQLEKFIGGSENV